MIRSANGQGIAWMVLGMFGFAVCDALLKLVAGVFPLGQIMIYQGLGAGLFFGFMAWRSGAGDWLARFRSPVLLVRGIAEAAAATGFVAAFATVSLSTVAAIIQSNPLLVTMGAALMLGERVGPWRWGAIAVGLVGVLLVLKPGSDAFEPGALYAVGAVLALSVRDLLTRWVPKEVPTFQIGTFAMVFIVVVGALLQLGTAAPIYQPNFWELVFLLGSVATLPIGIYGTTAAMRVGEISVVTPFRYSRLIFAMILAALIFGERPDALTYLGAALIVGTGIFTLWRERRAKQT